MILAELPDGAILSKDALLAAAVGGIDGGGDAAKTLLGDGTFGTVPTSTHSHDGGECTVAGDSWSGSLAGSGVGDLQGLADWIDANVTAG